MSRTRRELLIEIEDRIRKAGIYYQDIWERILDTKTEVLREIAESDFERLILERVRPAS